jgi:hypothetical protein
MNNRYRPDRHDLVGVELLPGHAGRGANRRVTGWFVRITYTGDPVREFRGERCEVRHFDTEHEARSFFAEVV